MVASREHPIVQGLVALFGTAVAIGLFFGLAALLAAQGLGVGGSDETARDTAGSDQSMYLPKPKETNLSTGPLVTLGPGESETPASTGSAQPATGIVLQAGQTEVAPMQQIDLTGTYAGGEGAVLEVQRFANGEWEDFYGVGASVTNGTFATYVQTSQTGPNRFRMADTDTGVTSNEVVVKVG